MKDELSRYKFIKKSNVQIAYEDIVNNVSKRLWESNGYMDIYYAAIVNYLYELSKSLGSKHYFTKDDLLMIINEFHKGKDTPEEVKKLCKTILNETGYKSPKFNLGDKFYIDQVLPYEDCFGDSKVLRIYGDYYITKIDDTENEILLYYLTQVSGGHTICVIEDVLEKSEKR